MPSSTTQGAVRPVPAVAAAVLYRGRVLMVRRSKPPNQGMLALPGGKIEPGEPLLEAAVRELHEESGISAEPEHVMTAIDQLHHDPQGALLSHHVIVVVRCRWVDGKAAAGDDACEVRWLSRSQLERADDLCASARHIAAALLESAARR